MPSYISDAVDRGMTGKDIADMLIKSLGSKISEENAKKLSDRIDSILQTSAEDIVRNFVMRRISAEFGKWLGNVNHPRTKASVELRIKNDSIIFSSSGDQVDVEKFFSLQKNLIYIDDPFIIDDINDRQPRYDRYRHRNRLLGMLRRSARSIEQTSVEEIIGNQKIEQIINEINKISDGKLVLEDNRIFAYKHSSLRKSLSLQNVSTGIKTFIIIKKLLQDGILEENGIAVFDEPEVHLHPEWQINLTVY